MAQEKPEGDSEAPLPLPPRIRVNRVDIGVPITTLYQRQGRLLQGDHCFMHICMFTVEVLPDLRYSLDVWHAAKNLAKDLRAASNQRGCKRVAEWIISVKNHFWRCASMANGDRTKFMVSLVNLCA